MYYQQGDVIIEPFAGEIEGKKANQLVLAEGEVTGHAHRVMNGLAELFENGNTKYLLVKEPVKVTHEEHGVVELPIGKYRIRKVREYDHFAEEAKEVQD